MKLPAPARDVPHQAWPVRAPTLFAVRLQIGFKQTLDGVEIQKVKHTSQTRLAGEYNLCPLVIKEVSRIYGNESPSAEFLL